MVGWVVMDGATGAAVAVPVSGMFVVGVCGSLLVMVMLPESPPTIVGENNTLKDVLPPGAMVLGVVIPEIPKGPPLTDNIEMIRFVLPVFVSVNAPSDVAPTVVLPRFRLPELTLICGDAAVAVPASATCSEETPLSVWTDKVPVTFPAVEASNQTWKLLDCPAAKERGMAGPDRENWPLERFAFLILTVLFPVFATVTVWETFLPTTVLPKLRLLGVN